MLMTIFFIYLVESITLLDIFGNLEQKIEQLEKISTLCLLEISQIYITSIE